MADSEAVAGLYSLPTPLVSHIMALCDARGACALAQTCSSMRMALDDAVWAAHCARVPFCSPVGTLSHRFIYVLAHLWNGWPLGWWWCTSNLPRGHLLDITLQLQRDDDGAVTASLVLHSWGAFSSESGDCVKRVLPLGTLEELTEPNPANCCPLVKAIVQLVSPAVLHLRERFILDLYLDEGRHVHRMSFGEPDYVYERVPGEYAACGLRLPTALEPPGCLAGIHSSYYGSHGVEYILVRCLDRQQVSSALPAQLAVGSGQILTGLKLKGDPNVPSGQLTFVADLGVMEPPRRHGAVQPWDSYDDDGRPSPAAMVDVRPVVTFYNRTGVMELRLEERLDHVVGVYPRCWGQINTEPGVWEPQWVRACVIVYRPGAVVTTRAGHRVGPTPVAFTLLWNDDQDRQWRHGMDYCMVANALQ